MRDKRRSHRLEIELPASFRMRDRNGDEYICSATTINISATGIRLRCKEQLEKEQDLKLRVSLPQNKILVLDLLVMWVREINVYSSKEYLVGLKIIEPMTDDAAKFVKFYVREFLLHFGKNKDKEQ